MNALEFRNDGVLFAASDRGLFLRLDPASGSATVIGPYGSGFVSSGDLAFASGGKLFATVKHPNVFNDLLVRVDPATGQATPVSASNDLGFPLVFGLDFVNGSLTGLTTDGQGRGALLKINPGRGTASFVRPLGFGAFGASF